MSLAVRAGWALAGLGALAVAALTLTPAPDETAKAAATPLYCLVCGDRGGVDVFLNLLLFMPLGAGLRLARRSWREVLAVSALLSLSVELLQLSVLPGRDPSLSDLVSNTAGGGLGAAAAVRFPALAFPSPVAARRLFAAGIALWLVLLGAGAWLQAPAVPDGPLWSLRAGEAPRSDAFFGRVHAVRLNDLEMPAYRELAPRSGAREALAAGRVRLDAAITSGRPTGGRRWIYRIEAPDSVPQLFRSQEGRHLIVGLPAHALRLRFNPPALLLPDALPADSGQPVRIRAGQRDRRLWLAAEHGGTWREVATRLTPARGWGMVAPFDLELGDWVQEITALVIAALVLPLGYWGAASGRPLEAVLLLAAALLLGLGGITSAGGFPPVPWWQWAAGAAGAAAGWSLRRAAAYLQLRCGPPSTSESSSS